GEWQRSCAELIPTTYQSAPARSGPAGEQPPAAPLARRAAVFANLKRLGIFDLAASVVAVGGYQRLPEAVGLLAQPSSHLFRQPGAPLRIVLRHLVQHADIVRKPFVELRYVAIQHGHYVVEDRAHIHGYTGLKGIGPGKLVGEVGNDRVGREVR